MNTVLLSLSCRHTSRFLMIWLTCLPFALFSTCGLGTIPLVFLIAFLLLGEGLCPAGSACGRASYEALFTGAPHRAACMLSAKLELGLAQPYRH